MTGGHDALVSAALAGSPRYPGCTAEQALVYSCEDTLETALPSRTLDADGVGHFLRIVCEAEDLDAPVVSRGRRRRSIASADLDMHEMCIDRSTVSTLTVLHELAHLTCGVDSHGVLFRDELVRLCRAHVGVEHAALLHRLYAGCGLEVSPWAASRARPR